MFNTHRLIGISLILFVLSGSAMSQENRAPIETPREPVASLPAGPLITAAASAERVRFTAPSNVVRMQLQVISDTGQILFEVGSKGNVLDWSLQDSSGQRMQGAYVTVVTVKSLSGRVSERIGTVSVTAQQVELRAVEASGLTAAQQQAVGPIEEQAMLTIFKSNEVQPITVLANNGNEGQLIRERGALSFRLGDFYAGKDTEQMRLTEEGNLGIGTAKPEAKLDVAGDVRASGSIRASEGLEFADGSRLSSTDGKLVHTDPGGEPQVVLDGTGTTGRLAKWTNGPAGTLGNSVVTEAPSGKLGIGTVSPNYELTLFGNDVGLQLISAATGVTANDGFRFGISSTNNAFLWNTEATDMYFGTTATERMRIKANGNVGIGTDQPDFKLNVLSPGDRGLRVQTNTPGGSVASFGGHGAFQVDAPFFPGGRLTIKEDGKVGLGTNAPLSWLHVNTSSSPSPISGMAIDVQSFQNLSNAQASHFFRVRDVGAGGPSAFYIRGDGNVGVGTESPAERLSVVGRVESTSGGFKFPDGSVQTIAANAAYTSYRENLVSLNNSGGGISILNLNLPTGTYLLTATALFVNNTNNVGQNNNREVQCRFSGQTTVYQSNLGGVEPLTMTMHTVLNITSGSVDLTCRVVFFDNSNVFTTHRRLSAVRIETVSEQ